MDPETTSLLKGILGMGGIAGALWMIQRWYSSVKDKGSEDRRVMDKIEFLIKARAEDKAAFEAGRKEDREVIQSLVSELGLLKAIVQEFKETNDKQHNELEKSFMKAIHETDKRVQKLELTGCKPTKKADA